jgi:hypothetical protein
MDSIDKLAMQQLHDDMVELTAALKDFTEAIKNKDDIGANGDAIPVSIVSIGEDALAILSATPLTVTDGGTPVQVEVANNDQ